MQFMPDSDAVSAPGIPRRFHFVFGLKPQTEPFHLLFYLCIRSCMEINRPEKIFFHYHHAPWGEWWERISPELELRKAVPESLAVNDDLYYGHNEGRVIRYLGLDYAHRADFLRLQILLDEGGVYADMDTLFIRPFPPEWFQRHFVIGEEAPVPDANGSLQPSLCNAVMLSRPDAPFVRRWLQLGTQEFDGTWSRHSCRAAAKVRDELPGEITVLPSCCFYRFMWTRQDIDALFTKDLDDLDTVYSIHLWAHLWWDQTRTDFSRVHNGLFTPEFIRKVDTTYNRLARRFLPGN